MVVEKAVEVERAAIWAKVEMAAEPVEAVVEPFLEDSAANSEGEVWMAA